MEVGHYLIACQSQPKRLLLKEVEKSEDTKQSIPTKERIIIVVDVQEDDNPIEVDKVMQVQKPLPLFPKFSSLKFIKREKKAIRHC